jgi:hypothetical protein
VPLNASDGRVSIGVPLASYQISLYLDP